MRTSWTRLTAAAALCAAPLAPLAAGGAGEANITGGSAARYSATKDYFPNKVTVEYAGGFSVQYRRHYKVVEVSKPWQGAESTYRYLLVQKGTPVPAGHGDAQVVMVPIERIVTMSTTYLAQLDSLGATSAVVGHDAFDYVSTLSIRQRIDAGLMKEIGSGPGVNLEVLYELEPDVIMTYGTGSQWDTHPKLFEAELPAVMNGEYLEPTPLARAEWIKFIALFFNMENGAMQVFDEIKTEYVRISALARAASPKPTVFLNTPFQGTWWMPAGESYTAVLMRDAGADYLWGEDRSTGSMMLDFEAVYSKAKDADVWLNTGTWSSLADGAAADERFTEFVAFKAREVYNNNARVNEFGGNDFWESGFVNPHLVLADIVKILHPELLPRHHFVYYQKLD